MTIARRTGMTLGATFAVLLFAVGMTQCEANLRWTVVN
jgi:hypothetical protein